MKISTASLCYLISTILILLRLFILERVKLESIVVSLLTARFNTVVSDFIVIVICSKSEAFWAVKT